VAENARTTDQIRSLVSVEEAA